MKHLDSSIRHLTFSAFLAASLLAFNGTAGAHGNADAKGSLVDTVRQVSARFRDIDVAFNEGYVQSLGCISAPIKGAMGLHFMKHAFVDGEIDVTKPEMVLYEPMPNGKLRLIGVDYMVFYDAWHANHKLPPSLQGQQFFLVRSPNRYGAPTFYILHVWVDHNPNGAFAMWNPNVSCQYTKDHYGGES